MNWKDCTLSLALNITIKQTIKTQSVSSGWLKEKGTSQKQLPSLQPSGLWAYTKQPLSKKGKQACSLHWNLLKWSVWQTTQPGHCLSTGSCSSHFGEAVQKWKWWQFPETSPSLWVGRVMTLKANFLSPFVCRQQPTCLSLYAVFHPAESFLFVGTFSGWSLINP